MPLIIAFALLFAPVPTELGHVTRVVPKAELFHGGKKTVLGDKDAVSENDRIKTEINGRVRVVLNDGSILSLGSAGQMVIRNNADSARPGVVDVAYGHIRAEIVKRAQSGTAFEVHTSTAICGVLGTTLYVDTHKGFSHVINISPLDSGSQVKVRSSNKKIEGEVTLNPGQGTLVYGGKPPSHPHVMDEPSRAAARAQTDVGEP